MNTKPAAAASERAREFDDLLSTLSNTSFECGTWGTGGGEEDTEYLETLRKRDSAMEAARTRITSELSAKDREIERLRSAMNGNARSRCKHCRHYRLFPCAQNCGCDCDYEPEDRFPALESLLNEKDTK